VLLWLNTAAAHALDSLAQPDNHLALGEPLAERAQPVRQ